MAAVSERRLVNFALDPNGISTEVPNSKVTLAALPIIEGVGKQVLTEGDPAYALCYAGCNAALLASTLTPAGIILCFEGCLPISWNPPLSC